MYYFEEGQTVYVAVIAYAREDAWDTRAWVKEDYGLKELNRRGRLFHTKEEAKDAGTREYKRRNNF